MTVWDENCKYSSFLGCYKKYFYIFTFGKVVVHYFEYFLFHVNVVKSYFTWKLLFNSAPTSIIFLFFFYFQNSKNSENIKRNHQTYFDSCVGITFQLKPRKVKQQHALEKIIND